MEAAYLSQSNEPSWIAGSTRARLSVFGALVAGVVLRLWMFGKFFEASGDSLVYGDIAKNLLTHGIYGLTLGGKVFSTLIRLPGYPLFLAACFKVFGMERYAPPALVQIALELVGCLLLADVARRIVPSGVATRAAHATLWLAMLCPFTAVYAANPLTEGPTLFCIALALWALVRFRERASWGSALLFTAAVTYAALLRPDGALVALALAPALLVCVAKSKGEARGRMVKMAAVCAVLAVLPFAVWTARNWKVFEVVQPLAPKSATDPGDPTTPGWDRWVKTWALDFYSTYTVVWNVPGDELDASKLPERAFDSEEQRAQTQALADAYNANGFQLTPAMDAEFARLAEDRERAHPWRTHVGLPLARVADMWLRPRVENLPIDADWWVYAHHWAETRFSWAYAGLNAVYLLLGVAGLCLRPKLWIWMLAYFLLRSALLLTIAPPEARYTLECFPMLFVLGGVAVARVGKSAS